MVVRVIAGNLSPQFEDLGEGIRGFGRGDQGKFGRRGDYGDVLTDRPSWRAIAVSPGPWSVEIASWAT